MNCEHAIWLGLTALKRVALLATLVSWLWRVSLTTRETKMIKSADALLKAREEAIERSWVTDGAKADDPTIFVVRPVKAAKKNGYVFTNLHDG